MKHCQKKFGLNICPKVGKPFPNTDFLNHKLFPIYDAEIATISFGILYQKEFVTKITHYK